MHEFVLNDQEKYSPSKGITNIQLPEFEESGSSHQIMQPGLRSGRDFECRAFGLPAARRTSVELLE